MNCLYPPPCPAQSRPLHPSPPALSRVIMQLRTGLRSRSSKHGVDSQILQLQSENFWYLHSAGNGRPSKSEMTPPEGCPAFRERFHSSFLGSLTQAQSGTQTIGGLAHTEAAGGRGSSERRCTLCSRSQKQGSQEAGR